jgi:transposase-like protein
VDETYIKARGKWNFLHRAVDKHGKTLDFLLRPDRSIAAAQAFFRKALSTSLPRWPRKITLDGHMQSHLALRLLRREDPKWKFVQVRSSQYLNNLIEQDHRAVKRDVPRWEASSYSEARPLRWPASSLPIGFATGSSPSGAADIEISSR